MGHSDISWKFEIIGSWVGQGDRERGQGFKLTKVSTEFRCHEIPNVFCTFVSSVLRAKLSKNPRKSYAISHGMRKLQK